MALRGDLYNLIVNELDSAPLVEEFILSDLANISAVANALQPLVIARLKTRVSVSAIGMTLRRYKARMKSRVPIRKKFPKSTEIRMIDSLVKVSARADKRGLQAWSSLRNLLEKRVDEILLLDQGAYEVSITTHARHKATILKAFKKCTMTAVLDDVGCITVDWPSITKDIPGMYYRVTRALARRDISVQSFHSIGIEMMIVVRGEVLVKAHSTVRDLLSNSEFE